MVVRFPDGGTLGRLSYASLEKEPMTAGAFQKGTGFLFIEADALNEVLAAMQDVPGTAEVHQTF